MASIPTVERPPAQPAARSAFGEFAHQLRTLRSQRWGNLWGYVFVAPAVILYFIFQAWPIVRGLYMAFSDYRWIIPETHGWSSFNGLDNFVEMWGDKTFWSSLGIAFKYTIVYVVATLVLSLFVAVMISKVKQPAVAGFYAIAVGLLCWHLSHGVRALCQSLGFGVEAWKPLVDRFATGFAWVLFLGYVSIPIAVLCGYGKEVLK